jgi:hypothetical protein
MLTGNHLIGHFQCPIADPRQTRSLCHDGISSLTHARALSTVPWLSLPNMSHPSLLLAFSIIFVLEFTAFGMARAALLVSREAGVPYDLASPLLPPWFSACWIVRLAKWGVLVFIAYSWSWGVAAGLLVADFVLSSILPIPYRLYLPIFERRIAQIKQKDSEVADFLERLLGASRLYRN